MDEGRDGEEPDGAGGVHHDPTAGAAAAIVVGAG
jgi:hypothetical protein